MVDKANTHKGRRNWKKPFIEALRNSANVRAACERADVSRPSAYKAYHTDAKFAAQWDEAIESACDILEARAWERSKVSDQILIFLLRAHRPQKYTEKIKQEQSGAVELKISYVNDWRSEADSVADAAFRAKDDSEAPGALQMGVGGAEMAQIHDGAESGD